jgi:hypothetical protein
MTNGKRSPLRKLLVLSLSAGALLAVNVPSAAATLTVKNSNTGAICGTVSLSGSEVKGGCLRQGWTGDRAVYQGSWPETTGCAVSFDMRVGTNGSFYTFNNKIIGCQPFNHIACPNVVWSGKFVRVAPGEYTAQITECHTSAGNPNNKAWATVNYTVGGSPGPDKFESMDLLEGFGEGGFGLWQVYSSHENQNSDLLFS